MRLMTISTIGDGQDVTPWITSWSVSQRPNDLTPSFQVRLYPDQASFLDHATWAAFTPSNLRFTISGVTWDCAPRSCQVSIAADGGVELDLHYYPILLEALQNSGYGKHVVFLSCPHWQYEIIKDQYVEEDYVIYHKSCDPYISTGWTLAQVFAKIVALYNANKASTEPSLTVELLAPTLHLQQATVIYQRGQSYWSFLISLLPQDVVFVWDVAYGTLRLHVVEPSTEAFTVPTGFFGLVLDTAAVPDYTLIEATAGDYKPVNGLSFGQTVGFSGSSTTRGYTIITETLPDEEKEVGGYTETWRTIRTWKTDADGQKFALLDETVTVTGTLFTITGAASGTGPLREIVTTFTYENDDPLLYAQPRLTGKVTTLSGYLSQIAASQALTSNGQAAYLTDANETYLSTDYSDLADPNPVVLSAYGIWVNAYEVQTETKTYTQCADASMDWPEGTERTNEIQVSRYCHTVRGMIYDATIDRLQLVQRIQADVQNYESPTFALSASARPVETISRKIVFAGAGQYQFEETRTTLNPNTAQFESDTMSTAIDSKNLPASPTQYRLKQLRAKIGDYGEMSVRPLSIFVPTNNPQDAEAWWSLLYYQKIQAQRQLTLTSYTQFVPCGSRIAGGTVIAFSATHDDSGTEQVVLTVI